MIYGLIGGKLSHSHSPQIHNLFFKLTGKSGEYRLIELKEEAVGAFLKKASKEGYQGLNVTIPYKTTVLPFLDGVSAEAEKIGAVNTVTFREGIKGYNTDYEGIGYTLMKNRVTVKGKTALITGSGGSAKAVVTLLMDKGIRSIFMASRNPEQAGETYPGIIPVSYREIQAFGPFDIIINTTPVGMYPNPESSPLTDEQIKGAGFVFDLIYNPSKTQLIKRAEALGIGSVNGLYMLVSQAVKAQEIWQGAEGAENTLSDTFPRIGRKNSRTLNKSELYGLNMIDAIFNKLHTDMQDKEYPPPCVL